MKKITLLVALLLTCITLHSQINITQDFENGTQGWDTNLFFSVPIQTCSGTSVRRNLFYSSTIGTLESPHIQGQSNGNDIHVNFDYKIVSWGTGTVPAPPGWGNYAVQFSTNGGDTWNTITTIDDSNHVTSNTCATLNYTISGSAVPLGSDFALRFYATWADGDYYLYFDNIVIQQFGNQLPPANDNVEDAMALDVGELYADFSVDSSVLGATSDTETASCGLDGAGIWYKFSVPTSGNVKIETSPDNTTNTPGFDSVIEAFTGSANNLTSIGCNDNSPNVEGDYSQLTLEDLNPGDEIYFRVWENGGDETEPFSVSVYDGDTLGLSELEFASIKVYPNPTVDNINIGSSTSIDQIFVYNILGQEVINKSINSNNFNINISKFNKGAYFVKVVKDSESKVFKIIKN